MTSTTSTTSSTHEERSDVDRWEAVVSVLSTIDSAAHAATRSVPVEASDVASYVAERIATSKNGTVATVALLLLSDDSDERRMGQYRLNLMCRNYVGRLVRAATVKVTENGVHDGDRYALSTAHAAKQTHEIVSSFSAVDALRWSYFGAYDGTRTYVQHDSATAITADDAVDRGNVDRYRDRNLHDGSTRQHIDETGKGWANVLSAATSKSVEAPRPTKRIRETETANAVRLPRETSLEVMLASSLSHKFAPKVRSAAERSEEAMASRNVRRALRSIDRTTARGKVRTQILTRIAERGSTLGEVLYATLDVTQERSRESDDSVLSDRTHAVSVVRWSAILRWLDLPTSTSNVEALRTLAQRWTSEAVAQRWANVDATAGRQRTTSAAKARNATLPNLPNRPVVAVKPSTVRYATSAPSAAQWEARKAVMLIQRFGLHI